MENQENVLVDVTKNKVMKLKGFYIHLFIYLIGTVVFVLKQYFDVPFHFFPLKQVNSFAMAIWSIVFSITAIDILITFQFFGKKWEERKIKTIMEKRIKTQIWK